MRGRYVTVKVPYELATKLDVLVSEQSYRSRAEIVNDAIRRFIDMRAGEAKVGPRFASSQLLPLPLACQ